MYNLREFRWKKEKGRLWEKWTFLKLVSKEKKCNPNSRYTICLTRTTELLMEAKELHFHLSHEHHCPSWCIACTFLPQCLPESFPIPRLSPRLNPVTAVPRGWGKCNNLSPDWECLGLSLQHNSASAARWREKALIVILVRFVTMHDTGDVVLIWCETWCDFSSREKYSGLLHSVLFLIFF